MPLDLDPGKWEEVEGGEVVCLQLSIYLILGPIILCKPTIGSGRHHHHPDQKLFLHELKNFGLVVYVHVCGRFHCGRKGTGVQQLANPNAFCHTDFDTCNQFLFSLNMLETYMYM